MTPLRGYVGGMGLWAPGFADLDSWIANEADADELRPEATMLSPRLRRRTSLMTRMVASAVQEAAQQGAADLSAVRYVTVSAWGELRTTMDLLESLGTGDGRVSPTGFTNSVHNTATGYLSMAGRNREGSNAVAAGPDSVAMGFLDAMTTLLADRQDVIVVFTEEHIPPPFAPHNGTSAITAALHLTGATRPGTLNLPIELVLAAKTDQRQQPTGLDYMRDALAPLMRALHRGAQTNIPADISLSPVSAWRLLVGAPATP